MIRVRNIVFIKTSVPTVTRDSNRANDTKKMQFNFVLFAIQFGYSECETKEKNIF